MTGSEATIPALMTESSAMILRRSKRSRSQPASKPPAMTGAVSQNDSHPTATEESVSVRTYQIKAVWVMASPSTDRLNVAQNAPNRLRDAKTRRMVI